MSLIFTDVQIQNISGEMLDAPQAIITLEANKVNIQNQKDEVEKKDQENTIFYNHIKGHIASWSEELKYLDGLTRTQYSDADLDSGAKKSPGNPHFPFDPIWVNMQPKLLDSNNGNPTSAYGQIESDAISDISPWETLVKNGFTDGAAETSGTNAYNGSSVEVGSTAGFSIGDRIVLDAGGVSALAEVIGTTPEVPTASCVGADNPPQVTEAACTLDNGTWVPASDASIQVTHITGSTSISGARIRNYRNFTNAEREGTTADYSPEVFAYYTSNLETEVENWNVIVDAELAAVMTNDSGLDDDANADLTAALDKINTWQAAPLTGAGVGRYGDNGFVSLDTAIADRSSEIGPRIAEVLGNLGVANQAADGTFSGNGSFFDLFEWVDLRTNRAGGSLNAFYQMDLGLLVFQQQIDQTQAKSDNHTEAFIVQSFGADATGTTTVTMVAVTGLNIADTVKVIADGQPVLTGTIINIIGSNIELSIPVSSDYNLNGRGRLVKQIG